MSAAARVGDNHNCPMANPNGSPHTGGQIIASGPASVIIEKKPAAIVGDLCTCSGPPDTIANGSSSVFIMKKPAARIGDPTLHGGKIASGCSSVFIGG